MENHQELDQQQSQVFNSDQDTHHQEWEVEDTFEEPESYFAYNNHAEDNHLYQVEEVSQSDPLLSLTPEELH